MRNAKKPRGKSRIESKIKLPSDATSENISAKILTSISEAVEKPFVDELHKWMGSDVDRRSLKSSLSVSIYSDITFYDHESLNDFDIEIDLDGVTEERVQNYG